MARSGTRPGDIAAALNRSKAAVEARAGKFEILLKPTCRRHDTGPEGEEMSRNVTIE
jgi:hypothetical protein